MKYSLLLVLFCSIVAFGDDCIVKLDLQGDLFINYKYNYNCAKTYSPIGVVTLKKEFMNIFKADGVYAGDIEDANMFYTTGSGLLGLGVLMFGWGVGEAVVNKKFGIAPWTLCAASFGFGYFTLSFGLDKIKSTVEAYNTKPAQAQNN